jgi:hypothetical protein
MGEMQPHRLAVMLENDQECYVIVLGTKALALSGFVEILKVDTLSLCARHTEVVAGHSLQQNRAPMLQIGTPYFVNRG